MESDALCLPRDTAGAMSEENLEITRRAYEAFSRRDFEALVAIWDPDIEWHQFTQFPDRGVYRGVEEVCDRFLKTQLVEQFGDFRIDIEELVDAGDHVVMIGFIDAPTEPPAELRSDFAS
jgi:ketosteroid isomerase-like protein